MIILRGNTILRNQVRFLTEPFAGIPSTLSLGNTAYYKMDETTGNVLIDSLSVSNGLVDSDLIWNSSGFINGSTKYLASYLGTINQSLAINFYGVNSFTVSFWINTDVNDYPGGFDFKQIIGQAGVWEVLLGSNSSIRNAESIFIKIFKDNGNEHQVQTPRVITKDTWFHIVMTINQIDVNTIVQTLYLDSNNVDLNTNIDTNSNFFPVNSSDLLLGKFTSTIGVNNKFNGNLDEVAFWNRALTQEEVTELYNNGTGKQYPFGPIPIPSQITDLILDDLADGQLPLAAQISDLTLTDLQI